MRTRHERMEILRAFRLNPMQEWAETLIDLILEELESGPAMSRPIDTSGLDAVTQRVTDATATTEGNTTNE